MDTLCEKCGGRLMLETNISMAQEGAISMAEEGTYPHDSGPPVPQDIAKIP